MVVQYLRSGIRMLKSQRRHKTKIRIRNTVISNCWSYYLFLFLIQAGDLIGKALEKAKDIGAENQLNKNKGD